LISVNPSCATLTAPCDAAPADGVVDHAGRQDHETDVALGEVQVDQDLGDDRHRRDRHRGRKEGREQDAALRIGEVLRGHQVAEPEPEHERQHHAHRRRDQRRAPEVAQKAHIGLEPGDQHEQRHADVAEDVEEVKLRGIARKQGEKRRRPVVAEHRGPERDPRAQLANHRGQAHALDHLGADARNRDQQRQLDQHQEDGVPLERSQRRKLLHVSRATS
jgi:hypothetical protein